jgi:ubiquinone/menaquinone biosynthesis C-methylase UbiE
MSMFLSLANGIIILTYFEIRFLKLMDEQAHSAEYFGKQRDFWWNADFLELMAKRLQFNKVKKVLDVGCGLGHWGQILSTVLPSDAFIYGVERDENWVKAAQERVKGIENRFEYRQGVVQKLPFPDNTFDMVTCQTVLVHLPDVEVALKEMYRTLKPGGLILAAEQNNIACQATFDTISMNYPISQILKTFEFYLTCEKGQEKIGLGFDSVGDVLPAYYNKIGLGDIKVYLSDKSVPLIPPYQSEDQKVWIQQLREWFKEEYHMWDKEETQKCFIEGGGAPQEFEARWNDEKKRQKQILDAIDNKTYTTSGGNIFYLISGRK